MPEPITYVSQITSNLYLESNAYRKDISSHITVKSPDNPSITYVGDINSNVSISSESFDYDLNSQITVTPIKIDYFLMNGSAEIESNDFILEDYRTLIGNVEINPEFRFARLYGNLEYVEGIHNTDIQSTINICYADISDIEGYVELPNQISNTDIESTINISSINMETDIDGIVNMSWYSADISYLFGRVRTAYEEIINSKKMINKLNTVEILYDKNNYYNDIINTYNDDKTR